MAEQSFPPPEFPAQCDAACAAAAARRPPNVPRPTRDTFGDPDSVGLCLQRRGGDYVTFSGTDHAFGTFAGEVDGKWYVVNVAMLWDVTGCTSYHTLEALKQDWELD